MIDTDLREQCQLRLGDRVTLHPDYVFLEDWPGEYVVVGIEYDATRRASGDIINVSIASDVDLIKGYGSTDGFWPDALRVVETDMD